MSTSKFLPQLAIMLAMSAGAAYASKADHHEFEATLHAPFQPDASATAEQPQARTFTLGFDYPWLDRAQDVSWRLELLDPAGQVLRQWHGAQRLHQRAVQAQVRWSGLNEGAVPADGLYQARLVAVARDAQAGRGADGSAAAVERALAGADEVTEQVWAISVGRLAGPRMPAFQRMAVAGAQAAVPQGAAPAAGALPYTVYYGNLHSQTNHSDGGGVLSACTGAQNPQSGAYGPTDAYNYAMNRGLDFLMASEHNHMYDGSDSTNGAADPAAAKALYQSGLQAAADFNGAHADFLAMYGLEWGVISNGGHMNIFNTPELLGWESNSGGQLIADTLTAKGDYAGLYSLMRQRGWLGQFNHPSSSGQFQVNGVALGYTADGDQAMALCEVMNSSAFSTNTTETETGRSNYEGACNKALEAGYHVAFSTDQDNHCANWGASYTNRTGVLIPTGTPLSTASMLEAIRARRVFATMDKNAQLVLTANGHVMGERIANSGGLNLVANFASATGRTAAAVQIFEGVPGRNGSVGLLASAASATITPADGEHYYYARLTQDDGKLLWSAPVWVSQTASGDGQAPTVGALETGVSGTITLAANASDNVGVTLVEFYVDDALKGGTNAAPYGIALNSASLADGGHSLVAKAYDAAGNVGVSAAFPFSVSNAVSQPRELIVNGGFEAGGTGWTASAGVVSSDPSQPAHGGAYLAWLDGYGSAHTDSLYQSVTIPAGVASANLSFWLKVASSESTTTQAYDTLKVQLRNGSNALLATLARYSNLNKGGAYLQKNFNLTAYQGQTVRLVFEGTEGSTAATSFLVDDVSLVVK